MSKDDFELAISLKKGITNLLRKLKKLVEVGKEKVPNAPTMSALITGSLKDLESIKIQCKQLEELIIILQKQKVDVENKIDQIKANFGLELDGLLKNGNFLELSGQFPNFKTGFFHIEADAKKWISKIWYGPQQEDLGSFPLDAKEIFDQMTAIKRDLGSLLDPAQLLECIKECAFKVQDRLKANPLPINVLLDELVLLFKAKGLVLKPYGRKDFSFDMYRLKKSPSYLEFSKRLHLVVATRQDTSQKDRFLWIPDDDAGSGTTYASIKIIGGDDAGKKENIVMAGNEKNRDDKSATETTVR